MTSRTTEELFQAALALPQQDRATLAAMLADTLEDDGDPAEVAAYWNAEIRRRIEAAERGEGTFLSHEEVWQRLDAKYAKLSD